MSQQFSCEHCERLLITIEPTRFVTHGAMAIRTSALEHRSFVECPACGHETPLDLHRFGVQLS